MAKFKRKKKCYRNGTEILTNNETNFTVKILGDKCNHYKVNARILETMTQNLILGVDFLIKNRAQINFETPKMILDNKEYDISSILDYNEAEDVFNTKTSIKKIDTNEIPNDIANKIREYKINNPAVRTIESFKHTIHYTSSNIVSLTPYKVPINIIKQTKVEINRVLALKIIRKVNHYSIL
ncbi:hypothetical protein DMUE_3525 [Dictyocoela muelleri]|nr:hypothetical protein DMUE_3525 [Dictyocoela muelleri]